MLNLYSFQILYSLSSFQSIGITVTIQFSWEANTSVCYCTADNMVTSVFHVLLPPEVICDYCQPQDYHCCPSNYSLRILVWYFGSSSGCFVLFMFCLLIVYIFVDLITKHLCISHSFTYNDDYHPTGEHGQSAQSTFTCNF